MANASAVKLCPHCKMEVDPKASRCPHCQGKIYQWTFTKKFIAGGMIFIAISIFVASMSGPSSPSTTAEVKPNYLPGEIYASSLGVRVKNADTADWKDCRAILNGSYEIDYLSLGAGKSIDLSFSEFTTGLSGEERFNYSTTKPTYLQFSCKDPMGVLVANL